ncbi:MAG: hypothetical protein GXO00_02230 [Candidatus Diapherotrites archaeon]|nr:hypothetical protein [Candidatus Diapherotrites archaeon]
MGTALPGKFKRVGNRIIELYGDVLEPDFEKVKQFFNQIGLYPNQMTKRMRNMIAGYVVRRLKKIKQKG